MIIDQNDGARSPSPPSQDKTGGKIQSQQYLDIPLQDSFTPSSDDNDSIYSADNENERQRGRLLAPSTLPDESISPAPAQSWRAKCIALWIANKGLVLVLISQLFAALMNVTAMLLETSGEPLNTFQVRCLGLKEAGYFGFNVDPTTQIMFARMSVTLLLGTLYMWWAKVEHFPFGPKDVRKLLLARGFGGFVGHATVITFLAPIVVCWACSILIREPFTRAEQIAGLVSLLGVILIARPMSLFSLNRGETPIAPAMADADRVTSTQRLAAIVVALVGVFGAASAYTAIRMIGQRAHPLISVNYLAAWTTFAATVVLLFVPGLDFKLPLGLKQWSYLISLCVCGFLSQITLTTGLSYEKSSRATNMVYTNMLFALAFDKLVFDTTMGTLSILGSSLILGSALYIAVKQDPSKKFKSSGRTREDEEAGLVPNDGDHDTIWHEEVQEVQLRTI
ncbi:MAG: hypothetical protein Q9166_005063 [cf. Caloplaca sp. 2 TL-2023]